MKFISLFSVIFLFFSCAFEVDGVDQGLQLKKAIKLPSQISGKCGIENCHGLDITCGPNVPDGCDHMYAAGDNCRQFISCQVVNGQCELEKSLKFDSCKACVEKCERAFPDAQIKFFECESSCAG